jgi:hypothetical protein
VQVFTLGGSFSGGVKKDKGGEVFADGVWRQTTGINATAILSDDPQGRFRSDNYGLFFAWTGNSGVPPLTSRSPRFRMIACMQNCMQKDCIRAAKACSGWYQGWANSYDSLDSLYQPIPAKQEPISVGIGTSYRYRYRYRPVVQNYLTLPSPSCYAM